MQNVMEFPWLKSRAADAAKILDTPGLFREFARLNTDHEILYFAEGLGVNLPLETWRGATKRLRRAVSLWDKIKDSKKGGERERGALQREIHRALTDTKTPSHTEIGLTSKMQLAVIPVNLLAYMWLTFARVVSGDVEERRCERFEDTERFKGCHNYVYICADRRPALKQPGLKRDDTTSCSDKCRKQMERLTP
jgi:hypothetical protein